MFYEDQPKSLAKAHLRQLRRNRLHDPHVSPLTLYVDRLRALRRGVVPYFDPMDGGVRARLLVLLHNPGVAAVRSGFISRNYVDPTAKNMFDLLQEAGVPREATLLWNIVPWHVKHELEPHEIDEGAGELERLIGLLTSLQAIVYVGVMAQEAMPLVRVPKGVRVSRAYHPNPKLLSRYPGYRHKIRDAFQDAWASARAMPLAA